MLYCFYLPFITVTKLASLLDDIEVLLLTRKPTTEVKNAFNTFLFCFIFPDLEKFFWKISYCFLPSCPAIFCSTCLQSEYLALSYVTYILQSIVVILSLTSSVICVLMSASIPNPNTSSHSVYC